MTVDDEFRSDPKAFNALVGLFLAPVVIAALVCGYLFLANIPVSRAERAHRIAMESAISEDEKCGIEQKLADAYLVQGAAEKYKSQKLKADIQCLTVQTGRTANWRY